ncbi:MAG: four helix bundle protein [Microgenomates group bacterium]
MKIKAFTDLIAWQKAHQFVIKIYQIVSLFPKEELYGLSSQLKRAAISISSNIAEGFSRKTNKDKAQFYYIALGSLTEVQNLIFIARDLKLINKEHFEELAYFSIEISKLINSLIKNLK